MWGAPIHNKEFVKEMLDHVEENSKDFKTSDRIKGMLTVAYNVRIFSRVRNGFPCDILLMFFFVV